LARRRLGARKKNVWSQKKATEKLEYMHRKPLKRKLVTHPPGLARVRALRAVAIARLWRVGDLEPAEIIEQFLVLRGDGSRIGPH
jgi:hypothetical protein